MTLYERIMEIYPALTQQDFMFTLRLQNDSDGKGDFIAAWSHSDFAQPTQEQLDAVI